jgi:pSer/pThr/pTyr-binding forkhead associated (FHA) protein
MENPHQPTEASGLPVQGPHLRLCAAPPEDFVPLRLVLQPSGAAVTVDRPDVLVGRHTEADIRLPLPDVSRRHCRLLFVEGCWQVVDLKSLNGIFVNGEPVLQAPLEQGDLLRIGGFTFAVDLAGTVPEAGKHGPLQSIFQSLTLRQERKAS